VEDQEFEANLGTVIRRPYFKNKTRNKRAKDVA
jgi:hypothetical protein